MSESVDTSSGCDLKGITAWVRVVKVFCIDRADGFSELPLFVGSGTPCLLSRKVLRFCRLRGDEQGWTGLRRAVRRCPHCRQGCIHMSFFFMTCMQQGKKSLSASVVTSCFVYLGLAYFAFRCGNIPCPKGSLCFMITGYLRLKVFHWVELAPSFSGMLPSLPSVISTASGLRKDHGVLW